MTTKFNKLYKILVEEEEQVDWNKCQVCGGEITRRCKCSGPHDLDSLKKGHGRQCENGHLLGSNIWIVVDDKNNIINQGEY